MNNITGVAIKYNDLVICLPKPNRHHNVIRLMVEMGFTPSRVPQANQGFYTLAGEFLDREVAMVRAKELELELRGRVTNELFSENLW